MTNIDVTGGGDAGLLHAPNADEERGDRYEDPSSIQKQLKIFDAFCAFVTFTGLFFYSLRFLPDDTAIIASLVIAAEATYACVWGLRWLRVYDVDLMSRPMRSAAVSLSFITIIGALLLLITDAILFDVYTGGMLVWIIVNAAHIVTSRGFVGLWAIPLAKAGYFKRRVAIVGGGDEAGSVISALEKSDDIDVKILGMYDDRTNDRSPPVVNGYKKLGNLSALAEAAKRGEVDLVVISIPMTAHIRLMQLLPRLWTLPVEVRVCGQAVDMKLSPSAHAYLGKLPLLTVFSRPLANRVSSAKVLIDLWIAALLLVVTIPVMAVSALAVALSGSGSILVREKRQGFDNAPLGLFKFRTHVNEETDGQQPANLTSVGRTLQRLHIDRLPRLFNVFNGDLSMVGPAPKAHQTGGEIGHYERVSDAYCLRHHIKPGLTGWAQIHGLHNDARSPEAVENRVKYDLEYVDRASWLFDLNILLKTPFAWIRNERPAYTV